MSDFDEFWSLYPRKIAKKAALKAYLRALKDAPHATIIEGVKRYVEHIRVKGTDEQYICHATTWLNQGRWDDDHGAGGGGLGHALASAIGDKLGIRQRH